MTRRHARVRVGRELDLHLEQLERLHLGVLRLRHRLEEEHALGDGRVEERRLGLEGGAQGLDRLHQVLTRRGEALGVALVQRLEDADLARLQLVQRARHLRQVVRALRADVGVDLRDRLELVRALAEVVGGGEVLVERGDLGHGERLADEPARNVALLQDHGVEVPGRDRQRDAQGLKLGAGDLEG